MSTSSLIRPRNLRFDLPESHQRDWFEQDAVKTIYCDALSLLFPEGERFFIRSVKHYVNKLDNTKLRQDIEDFCIQEAYHTREHEAYNQLLAESGYDVEKMEARVKHALARLKKPLSKLAFTVAVEHLTSTLSYMILSDPRLLERSTPAYRDLWIWHAIEETEHKGVAYDLFLEVTRELSPWKRYMFRCSMMQVVTIELHRVQFANYRDMLKTAGYKIGALTWLRAFSLLFVRPGYYRRALGYYLRFYLPGFHPWKNDDGALLSAARERFEAQSSTHEQRVSDAG
ncbi:metal-dependent hydrolase [Nitrincola sp. MINF-07-Sa-05]|uniref:metal-dependent hydrolase n=1 Tax=Nitrincola salilacus TaxID=3400273 RepID=UPI003917D5FF